MKQLLLILIIGLGLIACQPEPAAEPVAEEYPVQVPRGFPQLEKGHPNAMTTAGIALGEQLFFDPILSADSTVSCASCHQPALAFTDGRAVAIGINGQKGKRNAPSLLNAAFYHTGLFWDGRAETLEEQALVPVEDPLEMGNSWEKVIKVLREHNRYPTLFKQAFQIRDTTELTRHLVAKALAQYQRSLMSGISRYDLEEQGLASFTESEKRGKAIFMDASAELPHGECGHCHTPPLFTDLTYMNNGLDEVGSLEDYPDRGRGKVTGTKYDNGRFRVPSLRNVGITAPYMHDGRFATLEEVVDHYNSGGHFAPNVDPKVRKLHLSSSDKQDLVNFLKTLTDTSLVNELK